MEEKIKPAIVVIAYNRQDSLKRLLSSIYESEYIEEDITLIISIDYWNKENPCYKIAEDFLWKHGKKIVLKQEKNLGLRNHVLLCGDFSIVYGAVILLEDDVVVSPQYYNYAVKACSFYYDKDEVVGIGLYTHHFNGYAQYPFYPMKNGYDSYYEKWVITWGECFCKNQWQEFRSWYRKNIAKLDYKDSIPRQITEWSDSSWSKYLVYYMDERNKFFVSPYEAYSTNFAVIGEHVTAHNNIWQTSLQYGRRTLKFADYDTSVKYNLYFENMDTVSIALALGISGRLLMDLYGECKSFDNYEYCLSIRKLPFQIVQSYGLQTKPIETNIFEHIEGTGIFLYNLLVDMECQKRGSKQQEYILYKYYYPMLDYKKTINYLINETIRKIKLRWKKAKL